MPPKRKPKPKAVAALDEPISLVLYGPSGNGKTSLAGNFPACKFLIDSQEKGISFLSRRNLIPDPVSIEAFDVDSPKSWDRLLEEIYATVTCGQTQTLVLESLTGIENICFLEHCEAKFNGNFLGIEGGGGFFEYARGPKQAARLSIPKLLSALDAVLESGKNVIVTAHSQNKEETDPQGTKCLKYVPYCDKDTWARIHRWASGVFFLGRRVQEDKQKKGLKSVAKEDFDRILFTEGTPYCDAKNWFGIHGVVPMGNSGEEAYNNLMQKF